MSTLIIAIDAANDDRRRRQTHPGLRCRIGMHLAMFRDVEDGGLKLWLPHAGWPDVIQGSPQGMTTDTGAAR
jgi:hypothetical protein